MIETIFQIPGLGREFVTSAFNRDYTLVLGTVILYAALIMALNLAGRHRAGLDEPEGETGMKVRPTECRQARRPEHRY